MQTPTPFARYSLCSDMEGAYQSLDDVQNGAMVMDAYIEATELGDIDPAKAEIAARFNAYCKLDTWAMVRSLVSLCGC